MGPGQAAQTGLGVGTGPARDEPEDGGGDPVPRPGPPGHVLSVKPPDAQDQTSGVLQGEGGHAQDVPGGVLTVRVRGDDAAAVGEGVEDIPDARLEGRALAAVYIVTAHMGAEGPGLVEKGAAGRGAPVVHHHDPSGAQRRKGSDRVHQMPVRLVSRDQHRVVHPFHLRADRRLSTYFNYITLNPNVNKRGRAGKTGEILRGSEKGLYNGGNVC